MKKQKIKLDLLDKIYSPRNIILIEVPLKYLKVGDYVSLDNNGDTLFKVLEIHKKYVLLEDTTGSFYERFEYIEFVYRVKNMSGGLCYYLSLYNII